MLRAILPHSHRGRVLVAGALLDAMATGLYLAVATLYFVQTMHIPAASVGLVLSIANICGLLIPMPVARLTRRLGLARVYIALLVLRGIGMAAYALADGYWRYLAVTIFFTAASRAALPLLQVLVGVMESEADRTRTMASLRTVNNIGLGAGFFLAGGVQLLDSRAAYLALFVVGGLAFAVVAAVTAVAARGVDQTAPAPKPTRRPRTVYTDHRFITMAVANAVMLLHDSMLFVLIPLWVVQRSGLSATVSSILLMLNTVITVLLQVRVARYAKGFGGSMRLLRWSVVALAVAGVVLGWAESGSPWLLVILLTSAVILLTIGENLHAVAGWELSFLMSPPEQRAQYLSLFSLGYSGQLILGPALMTSVVLPWGMPGLLLMTVLFVAALGVTTVAVRSYTLIRRADAHAGEGRA
ncbi:MAG TPA: MFS transporter [Micromonosporaceae bacterium]